MSAPKIIVIFYSRSGTTRRIATALSATLGGSVEEIVEGRGRDGFLSYGRSIIEARRKHLPNLLPARNDPSSFDLVVIGTPVGACCAIAAREVATGREGPHLADFVAALLLPGRSVTQVA